MVVVSLSYLIVVKPLVWDGFIETVIVSSVNDSIIRTSMYWGGVIGAVWGIVTWEMAKSCSPSKHRWLFASVITIGVVGISPLVVSLFRG